MTATEIYTQAHVLLANAETEYDALSKQLAVADAKEQDILHYIENVRFDAPTGSKLIKALKDVRLSRREVKDRMVIIQSVRDRMLKISNIPEAIVNPGARSYVLKTDELRSVLGVQSNKIVRPA